MSAMLVDSIQVTVRVYRLQGPTVVGDYGTSGDVFRYTYPVGDNPADPKPAVGVSIEDGGVQVADANGDAGGLNYWTGSVDIKTSALKLVLSREAGLLFVNHYYVEIATNHGSVETTLITLPVT